MRWQFSIFPLCASSASSLAFAGTDTPHTSPSWPAAAAAQADRLCRQGQPAAGRAESRWLPVESRRWLALWRSAQSRVSQAAATGSGSLNQAAHRRLCVCPRCGVFSRLKSNVCLSAGLQCAKQTAHCGQSSCSDAPPREPCHQSAALSASLDVVSTRRLGFIIV